MAVCENVFHIKISKFIFTKKMRPKTALKHTTPLDPDIEQ